MKKTKLRTVLLGIVCLCVVAIGVLLAFMLLDKPQQSGRINLNVMSFNILYKDQEDVPVEGIPAGEESTADMRVATRLPKLVDLLQGENIDIAGLQEVSKEWYPLITQQLPPQYSAFGQFANDNDESKYGYGEAGVIVYNNEKFTLLESGFYYLAPDDPTVPTKAWEASHYRVLNWAVFKENETGVIFLFNTTHFDNVSVQAREHSADLVIAKTDARVEAIKTAYGLETVPVILVGDFNAVEETTEIKKLKSYFGDAKESSSGATVSKEIASSTGLYYCPSGDDIKKDGYCIDFIFHTKQSIAVNAFKMIHTATNLCPYGGWLSDHNAVIANVDIVN